MPINIIFTEFTDEEILFATKDDANDFFENITVPDATTAARGVVKVATMPNAMSGVVTPVYNVLNVYDDEGVIAATHQIATQSTIDDMNAKITALQLQLNTIRAALIAAGQGV